MIDELGFEERVIVCDGDSGIKQLRSVFAIGEGSVSLVVYVASSEDDHTLVQKARRSRD